ncbi:hypothetical protein BMS3Bbin07_00480 [bacterium BMS3Bbin07]|nr:hypothetical protein BMS3Bbin07_00480 [bacterium BMS3Bbin07]
MGQKDMVLPAYNILWIDIQYPHGCGIDSQDISFFIQRYNPGVYILDYALHTYPSYVRLKVGLLKGGLALPELSDHPVERIHQEADLVIPLEINRDVKVTPCYVLCCLGKTLNRLGNTP